MVASRRRLAIVLVLAAVGSVVLGGLLLAVLDGAAGGLRAVGDPLVLAAVVGLLGLAIVAAVANALAGPSGPQGPDAPTGADRREAANEWRDPPGVDVGSADGDGNADGDDGNAEGGDGNAESENDGSAKSANED